MTSKQQNPQPSKDQQNDADNDSDDDQFEVAQYNKNGDTHKKVDKKDFYNKIENAKAQQFIMTLLKDMTYEERYEWVFQKKLKGNRLFKRNKFKEANEVYIEALNGILLKYEDQKKLKRMQEELTLPIMHNICISLIKIKKYENAIQISQKIIELDQSSSKAYCRRAMAYMYLHDFDKSTADYKKALQVAQDDQDKKNIQLQYNEMQQIKKQQQKKFKQMFQADEDEENNDTDDNKTNSSSNNKTNNDENNQQQDEQQENEAKEEATKQRKIKEKYLAYNDEFEEIQQTGILKYITYYYKKGKSLIYNGLGFDKCKRSNVEYQQQQDSAEEDNNKQNNELNGKQQTPDNDNDEDTDEN